MRRLVALLCTACLTASAAIAQPANLPRVGVLDLTGTGATADELATLTDRLVVEMARTGQFTLVERQELDAAKAELELSNSPCSALDCVLRIGETVSAEKMVAGTVGRVGQTYQITLRLFNVETSAVENTAVKECRCPLEELLSATIGQVAAELAGVAPVVTTTLARGEGFGILYVSSMPSGAQITLDGRPRAEKTPATIERLPAGEHVVRLVSGNLIAEERATIIRDDVVRLALTLRPGAGSLYINSTPPDAEVAIDGRAAGRTPLVVREIAAGEHAVRITSPDHLPWEGRIAVRFGDRTNVPPVTLAPCGYLDASVIPAEADILVDGRAAGRGSIVHMPIAAGPHRVSFQHADFDSTAQQVTVAAGTTSTARASLRSRFGQVRVTSMPPGANVSSTPPGIAGTTPLAVDRVAPGRYMLRLTMADRAPVDQTIDVVQEQVATTNATLASLYGAVSVTSTPAGATVTSTPAGISGTTPFSATRLSPGTYAVRMSLPDRNPADRAVDVVAGRTATASGTLEYTREYLDRIERTRQAEIARQREIRARRLLTVKRGFRWSSFGASVAAIAVGYKFNSDLAAAEKERKAAYEAYIAASTTEKATKFRESYDVATRRADAAILRRNVLYGASCAFLSVGVVLSIP